ncbi:MAG: type II toxin-antitoxin system ParD family antitoxin [Psychrosphaera sp.]|nr:type II toxin-antitoxin system ParD family antitoxin [Psychrosphaera sp.]
MNVNLSETFEKYIQDQLAQGTYNNASEVVREALRLKMQQDEIYQAKLDAFRNAIIDGENSGPMTDWDLDEVIQGAKQSINA